MSSCTLPAKIKALFRCDCRPAPQAQPPPQPKPIVTSIARMEVGGQPVTAIARVWNLRDVANCRLCSTCTANRTTGSCLILAQRTVLDAETPLYQFRRK